MPVVAKKGEVLMTQKRCLCRNQDKPKVYRRLRPCLKSLAETNAGGDPNEVAATV